MSGAVKQRSAAPPAPWSTKSHHGDNRKSSAHNGSADKPRRASLPEPSNGTNPTVDDVTMHEAGEGPVVLDVTLPSGHRMDISVEYNTPMLDLLVCLAGKCRLNPSGLVLEVVSGDTGKSTPYKPNQSIGTVEGRIVHIVNKAVKTRKTSKRTQPFEMTHRFTINLPRGQKSVSRVSPVTVLGDLVASICKEKGLDLQKYMPQLPKQPGVEVDLRTTVGQLGKYEINLVSRAQQDRHLHTISMPDLSQIPAQEEQLPAYMPTAGETKKRKGFLSLFHKKDRKFKPNDSFQNAETSSTASRMMSTNQTHKSSYPTNPTPQCGSDAGMSSARPKSVFAVAPPSLDHEIITSPSQKENVNTHAVMAPARKKRQAPAPPGPYDTAEPGLPLHLTESAVKPDVKMRKSSDDNVKKVSSSNQNDLNSSSVLTSHPSRVDTISRLHSRNSSDSSGYHDSALSGCESPESAYLGTKSKLSIDSMSIESSDNNNGDSGIHESPIRVSPIDEVLEKSEVVISEATVSHKESASKTSTLTSKKKRKAPAPPQPPPAADAASIVSPSTDTIVFETATTSFATPTAEKLSVQHPENVHISEEPVAVASQPPTATSHVGHDSSVDEDNITIPPPSSFNEDTTLDMKEEADMTVEEVGTYEDTGFDLDEILSGVKFDEEPTPIRLNYCENVNQEDEMMMMETASISSENIEHIDSLSKSERPCAFIPPPPPSEPPPPEEPVDDITSMNIRSHPFLVDKGTEVNDDNTSFAPSSIQSSPDAVASDGRKSEMALFVERMSKMAVETTEDGEEHHLNDSLSNFHYSKLEPDSENFSRNISQNGSPESAHSDGVKGGSDFAVSEEITMRVETVPPPPEFGDGGGEEGQVDSEDEEFTETVEELTIPLGPNGYDFSSAQKVTTVLEPESKEDKVPQENGVFRAEPFSIKPVNVSAKHFQDSEPPKAAEKEEFILTSEDLSNVTFLPPKPKVSATPKVKKQEKASLSNISSTHLIMQSSHTGSEASRDFSTQNIKSRVSQLSFTPRPESETDMVLEVKPISLLTMPSSKSKLEYEVIAADYSTGAGGRYHSHPNDTIVHTAAGGGGGVFGLTNGSMESNSPQDMVDGPVFAYDNNNDNNSDALEIDYRGRSESRASSTSFDLAEQQEGLQVQYNALQSQFAHWQEQLQQNQSMLSSETEVTEFETEHMQEQMKMQQEMMVQLQSTMESLQMQQQQLNEPSEHKASFSEVEEAAAAAEPPPLTLIPPPAPPAPPAPPLVVDNGMSVVKSGLSKQSKLRQGPQIERQLDPREELMIAIRNFKGEAGLNSVPVKDTKWVHSNR